MKAKIANNPSKQHFWIAIRRILCVKLVLGAILTFMFLCFEPRDALVTAARNGDITSVRILTLLGVDPSRVGWEEHFTPLGAASYSGQTAVVRYLIGQGVDVNCRDDNKLTALVWANRKSNPQVAAMLRQAGATE